MSGHPIFLTLKIAASVSDPELLKLLDSRLHGNDALTEVNTINHFSQQTHP